MNGRPVFADGGPLHRRHLRQAVDLAAAAAAHPRAERRLLVLDRDALVPASTPGVEVLPAYEWLPAPGWRTSPARATRSSGRGPIGEGPWG